MKNLIDTLNSDRQELIAAIESAIDHILANSSALNDGNSAQQARFAKLVIKHIHDDLQDALNDVRGVDEVSNSNASDDIPF